MNYRSITLRRVILMTLLGGVSGVDTILYLCRKRNRLFFVSDATCGIGETSLYLAALDVVHRVYVVLGLRQVLSSSNVRTSDTLIRCTTVLLLCSSASVLTCPRVTSVQAKPPQQRARRWLPSSIAMTHHRQRVCAVAG